MALPEVQKYVKSYNGGRNTLIHVKYCLGYFFKLFGTKFRVQNRSFCDIKVLASISNISNKRFISSKWMHTRDGAAEIVS